MSRRCEAIGCPCRILPKYMFCPSHWGILPLRLKRKIFDIWAKEGKFTIKVEKAMNAAVVWLAQEENRVDNERYRLLIKG